MNQPSKLIIIPDVRFPNEADLIHDLGGTLIKIDRNIQRDDQQMKHASETEIDHLPCDEVIKNIGTRVEFFKSVLHTLDYFGFTEKLQLSPRLPGTTLDRVLEAEYFSVLTVVQRSPSLSSEG